MPVYIEVFMTPLTDSQTAQVAVAALLVFIMLDVLFGTVNACLTGTFSSRKMREGLAHKLAELGYAIAALVIDGTIVGGLNLGFSAPVLVATCTMLCVMELGSLMEILNKMNPDLGKLKVFQVLNDVKGDGNDGVD